MHSIEGGISEFTGNVELQHEGKSLMAEQLRYDKNTDEMDATGDVLFKDTAGLSFLTQEMRLNLESRIGHTGSVQFKMEEGSARGDAERT